MKNIFDIDFISIASSSAGNAFLIKGYKTNLLLEAGLPFKKLSEKINNRFSVIDGCLVSHYHCDHARSIHEVAKMGVPVYSLNETFEHFGKYHHNYKTAAPNECFYIGEFKITPFDVVHDAPCLGYQIESTLSGEIIIFMIDLFYCKYKFENVTHWVIECNFVEQNLKEAISNAIMKDKFYNHLNRIYKTHHSLERLESYLKKNDLSKTKAIYLTHLSAKNSDSEEMAKRINKLTNRPVYICNA